MSLLLHCDARTNTLDAVNSVKPPEQTETYTPVSHSELIHMVKGHAENTLLDLGYEFESEAYGLAPQLGENFGAKMFGVINYRSPSIQEMALSVGIRNSYDQSLSVGVCMGAKVFVCDNLAFSGDIRITRKHTGDVLGAVDTMIGEAMEVAPMRHRNLQEDADLMKELEITDDQAYALLGVGYGRGVLAPRHLLRSREAWNKPPQDAFKDRNLWSLYNAMTEALKTATARNVLESHSRAHALCMNQGVSLIEDGELPEFLPRTVA